MRPDLILRGVIPANLMAFDADLEIDERNYRRHLRYLIDTPGVAGITTNANASEVATLTFDEQQSPASSRDCVRAHRRHSRGH
jgi:dihydrodipicolinate synthase/N-acetylneuraminate lyase